MTPFANSPVLAQLEFRPEKILASLSAHEVDMQHLNAVVGRGGLLKPLASGTYLVNNRMLDELRRAKRGEHASNLGAFFAHKLATHARCPVFIV